MNVEKLEKRTACAHLVTGQDEVLNSYIRNIDTEKKGAYRMNSKVIRFDWRVVSKMQRRDCFADLCHFIDDAEARQGCVLALYGLRRTGKTVLMEQACLHYGERRSIILECRHGETLDEIYADLDECLDMGKDIVFLDEITRAADFIDGASILADDYSKRGLALTIAGTDSLGISLAGREELLGRLRMISTTYVSFAEHHRVIGTDEVDDYIRHGGLMKKGAIGDFCQSPDYAEKYFDSAVAGNIARSVTRDHTTSKYREIAKYSKEDVTLIVNKLVEIYNGRLDVDRVNEAIRHHTIDAPISDFIRKSDDARARARMRGVDRKGLAREYAQIINTEANPSRPATPELMEELAAALTDMGVMSAIRTYSFTETNGIWIASGEGFDRHIIQPAIKYHQLMSAVEMLENDHRLDGILGAERVWLKEQIQNNIFGDVTENVVLFDTAMSLGHERYEVCKPFFDGEYRGEYDMLVYDREENAYYAFEIKHSSEIVSGYAEDGRYIGQDRHLVAKEPKRAIDAAFGTCRHVAVLYRGSAGRAGVTGTEFFNISEFLMAVDECRDMDAVYQRLQAGAGA